MRLKVYNGGIIAPLKCGTRYLDETFGEHIEELTIWDLSNNLFLKNVKAIIVREPEKHLWSAIYTEVLGYCNRDENVNRQCDPSEIETILMNYHSNNSKLSEASHWSTHAYQHLYLFWRRNRKNVDVIHLNNLSSYLKSVGVEPIEFDMNNYNFNHYKNWCSKEDLMLWIKMNHLPIWNNYNKQIEDSIVWYEHLINKNYMYKLL